MSKKTLTLIIVIILLALGGAYYWFFVRIPSLSLNTGSGNINNPGNGIFGSSGSGTTSQGNGSASNASSTNASSTSANTPPPALRELSAMPVGGMVSSTTASTTIVRWIDRGTGHIFQAYSDNSAIDQISVTTVPMIYASYWNTAANAFLFQSLTEDSDAVTSFYATLVSASANATTSTSTPVTASTQAQYSLAGAPLSAQTLGLGIAVSPTASKTGNQVFTLVGDGNGGSLGIISNFDGSKKTQIFDTPLTQLNVEWPATNTIAITTKGGASAYGFLYFVNPSVGIFSKVLGDIKGLSTITNANATEVMYSHPDSSGTGITSSIYNLATKQTTDLPFDTLAEKCVWSRLQTAELYCAIPAVITPTTYPDAYYQGTVSFNDSIWEIDTVTGDVHKLADLTKLSGQGIDAENLILSPNENILYFTNKKDLSLWSFDLNAI